MQLMDATVVLPPYLESAARGRRVAVFGDSSLSLGTALLERGARLVHVYDQDRARVAAQIASSAQRSLVVAPMPEGDLAVRDGAFDLVLVPDLTEFDDVAGLVAKARKLVAAHGYGVFRMPNPDGPIARAGAHALNYYELYDTVALQFPEVRMLGQVPFFGFVMADFAADPDTDVTVDMSLGSASDPAWYVAVGMHQPRPLDPYSIIQVPSDNLISATPSGPTADQLNAAVQDAEAKYKVAEARAGDNHVRAERLVGKIRDLEEELRHQRERSFKLHTELEDEKKLRTKAELELGMAKRAPEVVAPTRAEREEHERLLASVETLKSSASQANKKMAALEERERDLQATLKQAQERIVQLTDEAGRQRRRAHELDEKVVTLESKPVEPPVHLTQALVRVEAERDALTKKLSNTEALVSRQNERVRQLESGVKDVEALRVSLEEARQQLSVFDAQRERLERDRQELEARLKADERKAEYGAEIEALEQQLRDRGREITALRQTEQHHARLVKELVAKLELQTSSEAEPGTGVDWAAKVKTLAAECAKREAELQRAQWRVAELEAKVGTSSADGADASEQVHQLEYALFLAQSELQQLRSVVGPRDSAE